VTALRDSRGRLRPVREHEIKARRNALAAARAAMAADGRLNRDEIAQEHDVTPSGVSLALVILRYGTEAEIASIESGERGLRPVYDEIAKRVSTEQRLSTRKATALSAVRKQQVKDESAIWKNLKLALDLIGGMPRPADVAGIAKRNTQRTASIDRKIIDAYTWLAEFSDVWTK
jgi:hypothetical protein